MGHMPVASAAAEPPLDPPAVRARFQGFRVAPNTAFTVRGFQCRKSAYSPPITTNPSTNPHSGDRNTGTITFQSKPLLRYQCAGFGCDQITTFQRPADLPALTPYRLDKWSLARAPLAVLACALAATAVLVLLLSIFEDMASARAASRVATPGLGELGARTNIPQSPLELLIGWLDWRVVCGVGGVAAALSQVWLYRRLTTPPSSLEVVRN